LANDLQDEKLAPTSKNATSCNIDAIAPLGRSRRKILVVQSITALIAQAVERTSSYET
jgi:hypothetical protein